MKDQQVSKNDESRVFSGRRRKYLLLSLFGLVVVLIIGLLLYFLVFKNKAEDTSEDQNNADVTVESSSSSIATSESESSESSLSASNYYDRGKADSANQAWALAVDDFSKAIQLDQNQPDYYNRKSQAQYNLGQKDQAIKTLEDGIANNPGSDLLKSRLDVLQKEWYGNQPQ